MRLLQKKLRIFLDSVFFSCLLLAFSFFVRAQQAVFTAGENGYASFRIPAIVKAPNGDLLAICEGRVRHAGDFGNIDLVMKRSLDNGHTWSSLQVIVDVDSLQAGNPAPVVDRLDPAYPQGRIFIFYNTGNNHENEVRKGNGVRQVWYITSIDQGRSWSAPVNISTQVHRQDPPDNWRSYANTPGHGLQIERGAYRGRLYIAANHSAGEPRAAFKDYQAHGFYSDDHGQTFFLSESVLIPGSNESTAAELSSDRLLLNSRNQSGEQRLRIISISTTGGQRWDRSYFDTALTDPVCQGSVLNIGWHRERAVLAFSNAASRAYRDSLTLRISKDEGRTWFRSLLVDRQPDLRTGETRKDYTAYSDLVMMAKNQIGILYERNDYREIVFKLLLLRRDYTPRINE